MSCKFTLLRVKLISNVISISFIRFSICLVNLHCFVVLIPFIHIYRPCKGEKEGICENADRVPQYTQKRLYKTTKADPKPAAKTDAKPPPMPRTPTPRKTSTPRKSSTQCPVRFMPPRAAKLKVNTEKFTLPDTYNVFDVEMKPSDRPKVTAAWLVEHINT
jgi:hypothetical protein